MRTLKNLMLVSFIFLYFTFLNGCKTENSKDKNGIASNDPGNNRQLTLADLDVPPAIDEITPNKPIASFDNRMIIKSGSISIETESFSESEKRISNATAKFTGNVTKTSSNVNANGKRQGSISVRIPSDKFDEFISEINSFGKIMSQNISGRDVTEEYIDLEARLKTQRELEKRLLELLNVKTASLTDVVEVEQKLSGVRENIERTEGRIRFLKDQSAFSTLTISLFEPSLLQTSSGGGFFYEIGQSFKKGINGFTEVLTFIITFTISFLPILIFLSILFIVIRKYLKNRHFHKKNLQVQA